jgi:hypothetical protein
VRGPCVGLHRYRIVVDEVLRLKRVGEVLAVEEPAVGVVAVDEDDRRHGLEALPIKSVAYMVCRSLVSVPTLYLGYATDFMGKAIRDG